MAKEKTHYVCTDCGGSSAKWLGKCPSCNAWNTLIEAAVESSGPTKNRYAGMAALAPASEVAVLSDIEAQDVARTPTGQEELDRVLGGGMVQGGVVLMGGDPGIGGIDVATLLTATNIESERAAVAHHAVADGEVDPHAHGALTVLRGLVDIDLDERRAVAVVDALGVEQVDLARAAVDARALLARLDARGHHALDAQDLDGVAEDLVGRALDAHGMSARRERGDGEEGREDAGDERADGHRRSVAQADAGVHCPSARSSTVAYAPRGSSNETLHARRAGPPPAYSSGSGGEIETCRARAMNGRSPPPK